MTLQEQIYNILLTPIKVERNATISYDPISELIVSGQKYMGSDDEDMSDFAVGFYEIIYRGIIPDGNILNGKLMFNTSFAGDTMSSYNTIANLFPEAGSSKKQRETIQDECLPATLRDYKHGYHCLANFWLLPMDLGRTVKSGSKASSSKDYMDRFLYHCKTNYGVYVQNYPEYFSRFSDFEDFADKHFLSGNYICGNSINKYSIIPENGEKIIREIIVNTRKRAAKIADSVFADELRKYFEKYNLINIEGEKNHEFN